MKNAFWALFGTPRGRVVIAVVCAFAWPYVLAKFAWFFIADVIDQIRGNDDDDPEASE